MIPVSATLLRLYVHNDDRALGRPLYEVIVQKAREIGLAGASVFPAERGFGSNRFVHDILSEYTFVGSPVVIEVIDDPVRIEAFLVQVNALVRPGVELLTTLNPVRVIRDAAPSENSGGR